MLDLTVRTNKGKTDIHCPQILDELSVEQFQRLITEWDGTDWVKAFSINSGLDADYIEESRSDQLASVMYESIAFLFGPKGQEFPFPQLMELPVPKTLELKPIWQKDCPLICDKVEIPKKVGSLSIGQAIQARRSLEEINDLRAGISIVTAIYLQPLIDKSKYDHLKAIEYEQIILKMPITKIFPIGFFLLRKLRRNGNSFTRILNLLKLRLTKSVKQYRR